MSALGPFLPKSVSKAFPSGPQRRQREGGKSAPGRGGSWHRAQPARPYPRRLVALSIQPAPTTPAPAAAEIRQSSHRGPSHTSLASTMPGCCIRGLDVADGPTFHCFAAFSSSASVALDSAALVPQGHRIKKFPPRPAPPIESRKTGSRPGGPTELSRWRQPPETGKERTRPGGALETAPCCRPCRGGDS